jgi:hypothetical protein
VALPSVPGVVRVQLGWKVGADLKAENVLHFRYTGSNSAASLQTGAQDIATAIAADASVLSVMGSHVTFESCTLTDLSSMAEPHGVGAAAGVGTRSGAALPSGAAALVNLLIPRRYKGGKPRSYMPWLTATDLDTNNRFLSASATACTAGYAALTSDITTDSGPVAITSQVNVGYFSGYTLGPAQPGGFRKKIPTPLVTPHVDTVTSTVTSLNVGSQRRRNRA